MSPIENPITAEAKCDNCGDSYPTSLLSPYVAQKKDKKRGVYNERITACPICISELAGKRMGSKEPYDFSADPEMTQKLAYAQAIKDERGTTSKKRGSSKLKDEDDDSDDDELSEEEKAFQRELEEEERRKKDEGLTDMIDKSKATSAQDINDKTVTDPRRNG